MLRREGITVSKSSTYAAVEAAIKHWIPKVTETELLEYLASRCNERLVEENFFTSDAIKQIIDDSDQVELEKSSTSLEVDSALRKDHAERVKSFMSSTSSSASSSKKGQSNGSKAFKEMPDDVSVVMLKKLLPPSRNKWSWSISKDAANQRFLIRNQIVGSVSKSWQLDGEKAAAQQALAEAWQLHESHGGI
eukprot:7159856-Lingulodinium_polyedra.AAC.1